MRERPQDNTSANAPARGFFRPSDPRVRSAAEKIFAGARLSREDGLGLFETADLSSLGYLANFAREKLHGRATTFSVNIHINYSNICENSCLFCAFKKREGEQGAERLSTEEICGKISESRDSALLEIHITGALDPRFTLEEALGTVTRIKEIRPDAVIKAFTLVEIDYFAGRSGISARETMLKLKEAGVSAFPGGGAELFSSRVRKEFCPGKISGEKWLALAELAHSLKIPTNATMLYGIGESHEEKVDHLLRLRETQDRTSGFMAFIPLLFQKENTSLKHLRDVGAADQLRIYAVSRLMLDNIPHIKVHWALSGLKIAELSQWFGVDDVEGTIGEERIGHEGGAKTPAGMTKSSIVSIIERSGHVPAERNGLYRISQKN
jgi:aminodeoxyfutalosine synthase